MDGVEIELVPDDGYEVYIADVTKAGEKHLVYRYGDDGESLHISDAGQDELFFEVLDLADTANEGKVPDGTIFVCYEKIYIEQGEEGSGKWVLVADHEDFWDESQRIYMPYIDTTALDQKTEEHISYAGKDMKIYDTVHYEAVRPEYTFTKTPFADGLTTIIDTFSYENLIPGFTYELKGYIFYTYFAKEMF